MPAVPRPSITPANPERAADIRAAATELFAERGYRGTTINDIADVMRIRGPSLYKHVSSKQEILQDIMLSAMREILADQREAIAAHADPAEQLREMVRVAVLYHVEHRSLAYVSNRELASLEEPSRAQVMQMRDEYWRRARAVIDAGLAAGRFDVESSAVATFCVVQLIVATADWYRERKGLTHETLARQIAEMALRMVGADASE